MAKESTRSQSKESSEPPRNSPKAAVADLLSGYDGHSQVSLGVAPSGDSKCPSHLALYNSTNLVNDFWVERLEPSEASEQEETGMSPGLTKCHSTCPAWRQSFFRRDAGPTWESNRSSFFLFLSLRRCISVRAKVNSKGA